MHAEEAVAVYVARELAALASIEQGLADLRAGRVSTHEEVVRETREVIKAARAGT